MDNLSTSDPTQVTIDAKHTQNNTDTTFNKNRNREKGGEIVDDEVDDDQEKGGEIADDEGHDDHDKGEYLLDNRSMASPEKVTIGAKHTQNTKESTSPPTQVTTQAQNSTDTIS